MRGHSHCKRDNEYEIKCPAAAEAPTKEKPNCRQPHMKIKMRSSRSCGVAEAAGQQTDELLS